MLEVGLPRDHDADAHAENGAPKLTREILAKRNGLDNDDADDGHMLHDLVKADRVVLQTEIREDDKAHSSQGELGRFPHVQPLWREDAGAGQHEQPQGGAHKVDKGEGGGEPKSGIHDDLIRRYNAR